MSKFFQDIPDPEELERLAPMTKRRKQKPKAAPLDPALRGCDVCPLKHTWRTISTPKMPMSMSGKNPDILVLGANPSEFDDKKGDHLRDTYGKLFRRAISGRQLDRVAFLHQTRCHTHIHPIPIQAAHACSIHLESDLARLPFKAIIGVGNDVLRRFFPAGKVSNIMFLYGLKMVVEIGGHLYWYFPIYDLAALPNHTKDDDPERTAEYTVIKAELKELFRTIDKWGTPKLTKINRKVIVPQSYDEAVEYIDAMSEPVGLDFEGTRLKPYMHGARMLSAAMSDGKTTIAWAVEHSQHRNSWGLKAVEYMVRNKRWVAHNASMELVWLRYLLPKAKLKPFDDTRAYGRIYYQRKSGTSLQAMSRLELGTDLKALNDLEVTKLDEYPIEEVLDYNGLDALGTRLLYNKMHNLVPEQEYQRIIQSIEATVDMEIMGVPVDRVEALRLKHEWQEVMREAERKAHKVFEVLAWEAAQGKEFSISSNSDVADVLDRFAHIKLPRTEAGNPKTGEDVLKEFAAGHPLVDAVLDYREAAKIISTYIEPCLNAATLYPDKILHPSYNTMQTHTLRLSSDDPNIQNFPNRANKSIRRVVPAPPGHVLVPMDYGQVEARVLAMAAKDRFMITSFLSGQDIHMHWLLKLLEIYPDYMNRLADMSKEKEEKRIIKAGRTIIKTDFVFASFYGATPKTCSARTSVPLNIMVDLSEELWRGHPQVREWQKRQRIYYAETGCITGLTCHVRHGSAPGNEVINTPIQSVAGDIMLDALNELSALARKEKDPYLQPRMSIHDDLTFILPEEVDVLEAYIWRIAEIMVKIRYPWQIVPLVVEAKIGNNWCDLEEIFVHQGDYVK